MLQRSNRIGIFRCHLNKVFEIESLFFFLLSSGFTKLMSELAVLTIRLLFIRVKHHKTLPPS